MINWMKNNWAWAVWIVICSITGSVTTRLLGWTRGPAIGPELYGITDMRVMDGRHAIFETDDFDFWGWSDEYIVGQQVKVEIKIYNKDMREQLSNDVKSFIVTDDTKLHVIKMADKKFGIIRVGPKTSTVEQVSAKQLKDKYNVSAW